ncbi:type II toxin-antitoxin system prevent-host-death family antitoxin (plasmid) [Croceicoccus marinus]|uniref:Type II toxin-antitoxin system prevent-host-death family antitoxin n=2 Tax=Croceicoccus marinus TaxID=450378 RepID=A0A7G6W1F8_9SPHN|nr:type II toxin-antitoxin system prevent-host-death family antitoxin [Croceicoccus marinus]
MPNARPIESHQRVPLTRFHNNTGEFLDLSTRAPVVLTSHGRERHIIADVAYFRHLEDVAAGRLLDAMSIEAVRTADMTDEDRAAFEAARPTADELANDQWDD